MPILVVSILWLSLSFPGCHLAWAGAPQSQEAHENDAQGEFFSGLVQEVSETSVSVSRSLPGKPAEIRVFTIDTETIVEGKLKKLARVTVGYRSHDGQDHAWRIIVRESPE